MPRQLLDKPMHKVDIGITMTILNPVGMDPSGVITISTCLIVIPLIMAVTTGQISYPVMQAFIIKQTYEKKTFGIWNVMVQKRFNKNTMMYFGINNIFNHRDDDRATKNGYTAWG